MPSKGTTNQRGYNYKHQKLRKQVAPLVAAGKAECWRCKQPIHPGQPWDLGHSDTDRTRYMGPEHRGKECPAGGNRATAGRRNPASTADTSRPW